MHKICEICKKAPATVHLTDIKNNIKKDVHMCESCAAKKGINIAKSISLQQLYSNSQNAVSAGGEVPRKKTNIVCEHCGISWGSFREKGRLGCPHDYEVFRKGLAPLLEDVHATRSGHKGKSPRSTPQKKQQLQRLELQRQLREAVAREDYEDAAKLRDRISVMEASQN